MNKEQTQGPTETGNSASVDPLVMWISVEDRLPDIDVLVLCFSVDQMFVGFRSAKHDDTGRGWSWAMQDDVLNADCHRNDVFAEVTHWMPLPKPPSV